MKGILGTTAVIIAALSAVPASAGTLYKCVGGDGATSYVSKRVAGASCSVISYAREQARPRPVARTAPAQPASTPAPAPAKATAMPGREAAPRSSLPSTPAPARVAATTPPPANKDGRVVSGQVYSFMKDGVRHYTSARPSQVASLGQVRTIRYSFIERCFACGARPGVNFGSVRLNTTAFQSEIAAAARRYGVEEAVVRAIIHAESAYNPTALSRAGAQGLMQLMPPTAARFGVMDSYDAAQNISGGVQYLAWLLKRFNGDLTLAAAGYNAGEGAVDRHGGVPPYSETRYYVQRVGQLAERYRGALATATTH
ncbi:lytic transglycosylase domain-containing protein [Stenotrophomonas tumulicola]|uniref:Lytic transglycosylase domain-containing protein n=1 Tax=Stenotrophomonas tumulicola TaxID=1685415 RepID=A0A7W3IJA3_9GAMM|nr:lytic transglycosylase domain-containing protein [Stenotrophomonas tumulicola]MBA8682444.1 lytic transglycosylase domain-containing protein [Stenotrophomonas tumulicola]